MPKSSGLGMYLYGNGRDLSGDTNSIGKIGGGPGATQDMTGIDKLAYERQGLLRGGELNWMSFFNPTSAHPFLSALPGGDVLFMVNCTQVLGAAGCGIVAKQIGYDPKRNKDGSLLLDVKVVSNGFGLEWGQQLTAGQRSDTTATNGAGFDYGAITGTTNFGLQMHVQLFSFTGTSVTIKIQSSTDDAAGDPYSDVTGATTGALGGAPTAIRVATATNVAVERYLRVVTTGTFSQASFAVVAVRNFAVPTF